MYMRVRKRKYIKPKIETEDIDSEISLIMMTDVSETPPNPNDPGSGLPGGYTIESVSNRSIKKLYITSDDNNPYGGSSPEY